MWIYIYEPTFTLFYTFTEENKTFPTIKYFVLTSTAQYDLVASTHNVFFSYAFVKFVLSVHILRNLIYSCPYSLVVKEIKMHHFFFGGGAVSSFEKSTKRRYTTYLKIIRNTEKKLD